MVYIQSLLIIQYVLYMAIKSIYIDPKQSNNIKLFKTQL